jgi:hypothetical protein
VAEKKKDETKETKAAEWPKVSPKLLEIREATRKREEELAKKSTSGK